MRIIHAGNCDVRISSAITKILGDWWASMNNDEKDPFTDLAQNVSQRFPIRLGRALQP